MNRFTAIVMILCAAAVAGCKNDDVRDHSTTKVGMLISVGGIGDRAFNDSAINGLTRAKETYRVSTQYVDYADETKNRENLKIFAEEGYALVMGVGFYNLAAIEDAAKEFPGTNFAIIDTESSNPEVFSAVFAEEEAAFLTGAICAIKSKSKKLGFLAGAPIPVIERMRKAFIAGAQYTDPSAVVIAETAGTFDDPVKGHELSKKMFDAGADIVFSCAGKTGTGGISAAAESHGFYFGTDTNQIPLDEQHVLGSRMKNIDVVVLDMVDKLIHKEFKGGKYTYSLKDNGLDVLLNEKLVSGEDIEKMKQIRKKITDKQIDVIALSAGVN